MDCAALSGLAELRPLVMAASVPNEFIEMPVLARMLEMDQRQLSAPLATAVARGVLRVSRSHGVVSYRFIDPAMRQAAYASIDRSIRLGLHRRVAEALQTSSGAPPLACAAWIAGHYEAAAAWATAVWWWRTAGERAAIDASPKTAVEYTRRALSLCAPGGPAASPKEELATLSQLGPLEAQLQGSGSKSVADVYARCLEVADRFDPSETSSGFDVLWGLVACILVHGRVATAREIGAKLLRTAEASANDVHILLATRLEGLAALLGGEIDRSIEAFERVGNLYDFRRHAGLRFRFASDQAAVALAHKSWAEAIAGRIAASERSATGALEQLERLRHPHTSAHVSCVLAARAQTLGCRDTAAPLATAGLALARWHRFIYWEAWAQIILAWHEAGRHARAGAIHVDGAIEAYRSTGAGQALPYAQMLRASIALAAGDRATAMAAADAGLELILGTRRRVVRFGAAANQSIGAWRRSAPTRAARAGIGDRKTTGRSLVCRACRGSPVAASC